MKLHSILFLLLTLFAAVPAVRANYITYKPWTGDADTGIVAGQTLWAYHFGSSAVTTVNGVTVSGLPGLTPQASGQFAFSAPGWGVSNDSGNDLTQAGGGSAVLGASRIMFNTSANLTLQGLTAGTIYTVSFFNVGVDLDPAPASSTIFTVGNLSHAVNQQTYGRGRGIRVDCTFRAGGTTQTITVDPTPTSYVWRHYALALKVHTGHTAYLFKTDNTPVPTETEAAILAHGGPDTAVLSFGPGVGGQLNGVPVYDTGAVTLPRYDLTIGIPQGVAPQARHFIVAGNLTVNAQTSLWGCGDLLLKLEVLNNAALEPGSLVSVAAQGRIGGAGGGDGGVAAPHPAPVDVSRDIITQQHAPGGKATGSGIGGTGMDGNPVLTYGPLFEVLSPDFFASAISGAAGTNGQGDGYYYEVAVPGGQPPVQVRLSSSQGGAGASYTNGYPGGGAGGAGGLAAFGQGFRGQDGQAGGPGANGRDGGNGMLMTLAGTVNHLRGGSGGGAGATGGYGVGGRSGGGGGGGGFASPGGRGGYGGFGGYGGLPGRSGIGGNGGGGAGGLLLLVRGSMVNEGAIHAQGGNGIAGQAGSAGGAGEGGGGGEGGHSQHLGPTGGDGGRGGNGGAGGRGGNGGNGASGSGGNIQIAAGSYQAINAVLDVSGGVGAPAGRVQIHTFTGVTQHAPFGSFAAGLSRYRSYTSSSSLGAPTPDPALIPFLPLEGGAATGGLGTQSFVSDAMITALQPPVHAAAAVVRVPAGAFFAEYPNHDLIVFTSLKSGIAVNGPRLSLVNGGDANESNTGNGWVPNGPQWLMYKTGDASNPAFVPGAPGPSLGPIPWNRGFMTLVEKGKTFTVTAQYGPYSLLRSFTGDPVLASLSPVNYTGSAVFLYDRGLMRSTVKGGNITNFNVIISESDSETGTSVSGETFYRTGVHPTVKFSATNIGNAWSRGSGQYSIRYTPPAGSETTLSNFYGNAMPGTPVFGQSITAAAGTVPNTQRVIGEFTLLPDYDLGGPQAVVHTVTANVLGPQSTFSGLTGTAFGPGVHFSTGGLSAVTQSIQLTNTAPVRPEWLTFAGANPDFTRLGIVSASFVGPNAAAFSVTAPSTLDRSASGNVSITFTPPAAGSFSATLRIVTDEGVNNGVPGRIIDIPVTAFVGFMETYDTWALALPPALRDRNYDADGNGIPNFMDYGLRGVPLPSIAPATGALNFTLPVADRSDVRWSIAGSSDLQNWQALAVRGTTGTWSLTTPADTLTEVIAGANRQFSFTRSAGSPRYFMRLTANQPDIAATYNNDFAAAPRALLYGSAEWHNAGLRLTSANFDQMGSAILDGVEVWPSQTGFRAAFNLTTGPGSIPNPADGASFSVGHLPGNEWGEDGPEAWESSRNLTICFDTYGTSGGFEVQRGIRIRVNRDLVLYSGVNPYSNGAARAVEIIYTPTEGLTVKFNGSNVFTNVSPGSFALQPGDRFGFGGRTGGLNQVNRIDDVIIEPR